jgi:precorrin-2/cobalt-factor-2 C20-methyltransferase
MEYPVTTDFLRQPEYTEAAPSTTIGLPLHPGRHQDVLVLCEGDLFFYGSNMHLHRA